MDNYRILLENKEKLIVAMKKSNENSIPVDFTPVDEQFRQLVDTLTVISFFFSFYEIYLTFLLANLRSIISLGRSIQSSHSTLVGFSSTSSSFTRMDQSSSSNCQ